MSLTMLSVLISQVLLLMRFVCKNRQSMWEEMCCLPCCYTMQNARVSSSYNNNVEYLHSENVTTETADIC